ncbi:MAG: serine/threonine-protein kinase [Thermofilaceae archaeon]
MLEIEVQALYAIEEHVLSLREVNGIFFALSEVGRLYAFDENNLRVAADPGLPAPVAMYHWCPLGRVALSTPSGQGMLLCLLDVEQGVVHYRELSERVAGIACTGDGILYWRIPKESLLRGILGFTSQMLRWEIETPLFQAVAFSEGTIYASAFDGSIYKASLSERASQLYKVAKIRGRVRKLVPVRGSLFVVTPQAIKAINAEGNEVFQADITTQMVECTGKRLAAAGEEHVLLVNAENWTTEQVKTGKIYDIAALGDKIVVLTKDKVIIIGEESLEEYLLGGLPAARIAVAQRLPRAFFAISFLQSVAYCRLALPTPEVSIKLAHDEPAYEVRVLLRAPSSLNPMPHEKVLLEIGGERREITLDEEGRATLRVPVSRATTLRIESTVQGAQPVELALTPPPARATRVELTRGDRLQREGVEWFVQEVLGSGGLGTVYRVLDPLHERSIAFKVPHGDPVKIQENLGKLLDEAWFMSQASRKLNTDKKRVVDIYGFEKLTAVSITGKEKGTVYGLAMEYVEGGSLENLINAGTAPIQLRLKIAVEAAEALAKLHEANIVHGDIKPQNILLRQNHPILSDFGAARLFKAIGEALVVTQYTPAYSAPETLQGVASDKSDVYSFGTVLIELLAEVLPVQYSSNLPSTAIDKIKSLKSGVQLLELLSRTRRTKPEERPSSRELYESLARMYGPA